MADEFRSSDLDFAQFLLDVDPVAVGRERWSIHHLRPISEKTFALMLAQVEQAVSPELVKQSAKARQLRRPGTRTAAPAAETST